MRHAIREKDEPAAPKAQRAHNENLRMQIFSNSSALSSPKEQALYIARALECQKPHCRCHETARTGKGLTHCPAHDDEEPSLNLDFTDSTVLFHCFGSCTQETVMQALRERGLWGSPGLTLEELARAKKLSPNFLRSLGVRTGSFNGKPAVVIPYYGEDGRELARRYRISLSGDRFRWRKGAKVVPYGLNKLSEARRVGWVFLVEGESDCWTLWSVGLPALGLPGKNTWRTEWASYLQGLDVYVWIEPDAEDGYAAKIAQDLPNASLIFARNLGVKDPSEAFVHIRTHSEFLNFMKKARDEAVLAEAWLKEAQDARRRELKAKAKPVLEADDPWQVIRNALIRSGYGGDTRPLEILYLALTSRVLKYRSGEAPIHLVLIGSPGTGKTHTIKTVLQFFPETAYKLIDASSPRALIYTDADLRHKAVIYSEIDSLPQSEDNPAASALRALLQDNALHYEVVIRDERTGRPVTEHIRKDGPTVLITTSTRVPPEQLATRMFPLPMREDREQIRNILLARAHVDDLPPEGCTALVAFQELLQMGAPWDVAIPYLGPLVNLFSRREDLEPRAARDLERIKTAIKCVALIRQSRRRRDECGQIVAELEDYAVARKLFEELYAATVVLPNTRKVVEAVIELFQDTGKPVSYKEVAKKTGLGESTVRRRAEEAIKKGWLIKEGRGRGTSACLRPGPESLPPATALPTPAEVEAAWRAAGQLEKVSGLHDRALLEQGGGELGNDDQKAAFQTYVFAVKLETKQESANWTRQTPEVSCPANSDQIGGEPGNDDQMSEDKKVSHLAVSSGEYVGSPLLGIGDHEKQGPPTFPLGVANFEQKVRSEGASGSLPYGSPPGGQEVTPPLVGESSSNPWSSATAPAKVTHALLSDDPQTWPKCPGCRRLVPNLDPDFELCPDCVSVSADPRLHVLRLAALQGFPTISLGGGRVIGPGRDGWTAFAKGASPGQVWEAMAALMHAVS